MAEPTDRELLEAAARSAGLLVLFHGPLNHCYLTDTGGASTLFWDPLQCDGDALRLAVKLGIELSPQMGATFVFAVTPAISYPAIREPLKPDPYAATRRAIVRAAAAIDAQARGLG